MTLGLSVKFFIWTSGLGLWAQSLGWASLLHSGWFLFWHFIVPTSESCKRQKGEGVMSVQKSTTCTARFACVRKKLWRVYKKGKGRNEEGCGGDSWYFLVGIWFFSFGKKFIINYKKVKKTNNLKSENKLFSTIFCYT